MAAKKLYADNHQIGDSMNNLHKTILVFGLNVVFPLHEAAEGQCCSNCLRVRLWFEKAKRRVHQFPKGPFFTMRGVCGLNL